MKEIFVSVLFLAIIGGLVWAGTEWRKRQHEQSDVRPSIGVLSSSDAVAVKTDDTLPEDASAKPEEKPKPNTPASGAVDPAKVAIKVMNGGAAKGSAVKAQTVLKAAGYVKAETGNTKGDYTGTTVYYLDSFKDAAEQVKQALVKDYPNTQTKQADPKKEEGIASVTVILGK